MESGDSPIPQINVVDRRFWARPETAEDADATAARKPSHVEKLERELAEQQALVQAIRVQHREAASEFESTKARLRRELGKDAEIQRRTLFVELLDVVDNLERAVDAAQGEVNPEALRRGVELVRDQLVVKLAEYGVRRRESLGEPFDPAHHEAISRVPVDSTERHERIVGVVKEGYMLGDSVLRPATVAVGHHGGNP